MQPAQNLVAETEEHDFRVSVIQLIRNQDPVPITLAQLHFAVLAPGSWITVIEGQSQLEQGSFA